MRPDKVSKQTLDFMSKLLTIMLMGALGIIFFLLVWYETKVLLIVFAGVLMAIFLRTLSNPLGRLLKLPDIASVILVILGLAGFFFFLFWALAPHIWAQLLILSQQLPAAIRELENHIRQSAFGKEVLGRIPDFWKLIKTKTFLEEIKGFSALTLGLAEDALIFFFVSLYLSFNPGVYIRGILVLLPPDKRERAAQIIDFIAITLRRWLIGRLLGMSIIGVLTGIGLWIIGIPLAFTLGLIALILTFIPYLGSVISAIPALLLAFLDHPLKAVYVLGLYLFIHVTEAYIISPYIQQHQVLLPPAFLITMQFLLGFSAGLLGLTLATPLMAMGMALVKTLYIEDVLGDTAGIRSK